MRIQRKRFETHIHNHNHNRLNIRRHTIYVYWWCCSSIHTLTQFVYTFLGYASYNVFFALVLMGLSMALSITILFRFVPNTHTHYSIQYEARKHKTILGTSVAISVHLYRFSEHWPNNKNQNEQPFHSIEFWFCFGCNTQHGI